MIEVYLFIIIFLINIHKKFIYFVNFFYLLLKEIKKNNNKEIEKLKQNFEITSM